MSKHTNRGFSLIEMMVALTVMAVLATIAIPDMRNLIRRNRVTAASNTLLADITYARTEAVSRGIDVSVCPSADGATCSAGKAYDIGWIVYTYTQGNAVANTAFSSTSASNVLLRYTQQRPEVSIQELAVPTNNVITFGPQGQQMPKNSAATIQFATCYVDPSTNTALSTNSVLGSQMTLGNAGGMNSLPLAAGAACN
jgi:type IV fimbrial biogenesis protein FimT